MTGFCAIYNGLQKSIFMSTRRVTTVFVLMSTCTLIGYGICPSTSHYISNSHDIGNVYFYCLESVFYTDIARPGIVHDSDMTIGHITWLSSYNFLSVNTFPENDFMKLCFRREQNGPVSDLYILIPRKHLDFSVSDYLLSIYWMNGWIVQRLNLSTSRVISRQS